MLSVRRFNVVEKFQEDKFNCDHGLVREMNGEGIKTLAQHLKMQFMIVCYSMPMT